MNKTTNETIENNFKHFVYLLMCCDGTLYCGYTNDLDARVKTHNEGKGAKYTRGRLPVKMVFSQDFNTKSEALKREFAIKKLSRQEKLRLIEKDLIEYKMK